MPNVTNEAFLRAIFRASYPNAQVACFYGDPGQQPNSSWTTGLAAGAYFPSFTNAYFCISTFHWAHGGGVRRRKDLFKNCPVIVLDDVREKLSAPEALAKLGSPSYRLQTSPGSEQWGYILDPPATEAGRVAALLDGLVKAGLNPTGKDPGMKGVTRLVRLPEGWNLKAKHGPGGVPCKLLEWEPGRTFTLDGLAQAFGIDLDRAGPGTRRIVPKPGGAPDPVLDLLGLLGLVQGTTGDGHTAITCPFVDEHTGGADTGTAYLSGGGFKCHHGHCQDRSTPDFLAKLDQMARAAGLGAYLARRAFEDTDKPALDALWDRLARGERPTPAEYRSLALVPQGDVERTLRPAVFIFGTDLAPIRATLARARRREAQRFSAARREPGVVLLPDGYQAPVTPAEARAAMEAAFAPVDALIGAGTGAVQVRRPRQAQRR